MEYLFGTSTLLSLTAAWYFISNIVMQDNNLIGSEGAIL